MKNKLLRNVAFQTNSYLDIWFWRIAVLIQESVQLRLAKIMTSAFLNGKEQLSAFEAETAGKLANVRIHLETVVGAVRRKYPILFNLVALTTIKKKNDASSFATDQIITVTCALTNLFPSIVSLFNIRVGIDNLML
jgi:hypothetical protein